MSYYEDMEGHIYVATRNVLDFIGYPTVRVFYAEADVLEPEKTYMIINILDVEQVGLTNEASYVFGPEETLDTTTHYKVLVQFTITGDSSRIVAPDFRHNIINNRACSFEYNKENLAFLMRGKLRNVPYKRETQWVDCFNFDVEMSFALQTRQSHDWVEQVVINDDIISPPTQ